MNRTCSITWFARHELRLAWRDWQWLLSGGRHKRAGRLIVSIGLFALLLHGVAYLSFARSAGLFGPPDIRLLVPVTGMLALYASLMLSQGMEAVTRAFYERADLDLILSSPVSATRVFAVRIAAMAASVAVMSLALAAPFINVMAWFGGIGWLGGYGVVVALAMISVAMAVAATVTLFRTIGPRRTRLVAQILAAVIGAGFIIGLQFAAVQSYGTLSRIAFMQSDAVIGHAPAIDSNLWWPARAVLGDPLALAIVLGAGILALGIAISFYAPLFEQIVAAAAAISKKQTYLRHSRANFRVSSPAQALRRKEWVLLRRDPWLLSQSLMQLLYLLPPVFLLWEGFYRGTRVSSLLVPVLIVAAGQLSGGLAWLAVSGEDAPDLIASAPIDLMGQLRAKTEAVLGSVGAVFGPFAIVLAAIDPLSGLVAAIGVIMAAISATLIQFWFRAQAKRTHFRRRLTSSRIATYAEAAVSIAWAVTGAVAAAGMWLAFIPGLIAMGIAAGAWMCSPARN